MSKKKNWRGSIVEKGSINFYIYFFPPEMFIEKRIKIIQMYAFHSYMNKSRMYIYIIIEIQ